MCAVVLRYLKGISALALQLGKLFAANAQYVVKLALVCAAVYFGVVTHYFLLCGMPALSFAFV